MMNNVSLIGRITRDLAIKQTQTGKKTVSFSLAVNRNFTSQSGEREADFINCVAWGNTANTLNNYTSKGSLIGVDGRLQTRSYDNQQGQRIYVTEVIISSITLLENKKNSQNDNYSNLPEIRGDFNNNIPLPSQNFANDKINVDDQFDNFPF